MYLGDLYSLIKKGPLAQPDYSLPYPQANTVPTIFNLIDELNNGKATLEELDAKVKISERQIRYYLDATRYLSLVKLEGDIYFLSTIGQEMANSDQSRKVSLFISQLSGMKSVSDMVMDYLIKREFPELEVLENAMKFDDLMGKNDSTGDTITRRAGCLRAWLRWIEDQITFNV